MQCSIYNMQNNKKRFGQALVLYKTFTIFLSFFYKIYYVNSKCIQYSFLNKKHFRKIKTI